MGGSWTQITTGTSILSKNDGMMTLTTNQRLIPCFSNHIDRMESDPMEWNPMESISLSSDSRPWWRCDRELFLRAEDGTPHEIEEEYYGIIVLVLWSRKFIFTKKYSRCFYYLTFQCD